MKESLEQVKKKLKSLDDPNFDQATQMIAYAFTDPGRIHRPRAGIHIRNIEARHPGRPARSDPRARRQRLRLLQAGPGASLVGVPPLRLPAAPGHGTLVQSHHQPRRTSHCRISHPGGGNFHYDSSAGSALHRRNAGGTGLTKPKPRWELHWAVMAKARQV